MLRDLKESDWKVFRRLHQTARERFCRRVLAELNQTASDVGKTGHERYLAVYKLMERRDRELAIAFDDLRRSTAIEKLVLIQTHRLLTEEEIAEFSLEVREAARFLLGTGHG